MRDRVRGWLRRLRPLHSGEAVERELAEELAHHIELETELHVRQGLSPQEARRRALLAFNGVDRFSEEVREARWAGPIRGFVDDVRYAVRALLRQRVIAVAAVLTMSLGIGANAAFFGIMNALVLRLPAGVPAGEGLVRVESGGLMRQLSHLDFRDLQSATTTAELAAHSSIQVALGSGGEPVQLGAELVTANYFEVLGMTPAAGRFFAATEDEVPARDAVVVLSHGLWQERFGGDDIVGSAITVNGRSFDVIGVAPPGFSGLDVEARAVAWFPTMTQPWTLPRSRDVLGARTTPQFHVVGRLAPGVTAAAASAELEVAAARLPEAGRFQPVRPKVSVLRGWVPPSDLNSAAAVLGFVWVLTLLVLLVCCANVGNLQLARALGRRRELAVRLVLGAGRERIVRMLVTETLVLAVLAGALGTIVAWWLAEGVRLAFSEYLGMLDVSPDARTLVFTFAIAAAAGLSFGLFPALRVAQPGLMTAMKGADSELSRTRLRGLLVGGQVAVSLVLLVTAGAFVGRLHTLRSADPGIDVSSLAAFTLDLHTHGLDETGRDAFYGELQERLRRVPGVLAVAAPSQGPLTRGAALMSVSDAAAVETASPGDAGSGSTGTAGMPPMAGVGAVTYGVSAGFFETVGVTATRGRVLGSADFATATEEPAAVLSDALALRLWGDASAVGRQVQVGRSTMRVVGTVPALPGSSIADPTPWQVFIPYHRHLYLADQHVLVRVQGDAPEVLRRVREAVRAQAPSLPVTDLRLLSSELERQLRTQQLITRVISGFGVLALLLAAVGLYGIVSSAVAARTREIGVRVALGARSGDVVRLFVGAGMRVTGAGMIVGLLLALAVGRLVSSSIEGVHPVGPVVLGLAAALLAGVAAVAAWLPARRAAALDAASTLRAD